MSSYLQNRFYQEDVHVQSLTVLTRLVSDSSTMGTTVLWLEELSSRDHLCSVCLCSQSFIFVVIEKRNYFLNMLDMTFKGTW